MKKMLKFGLSILMSILLVICCVAPLGVAGAGNVGAIRREDGQQVAYYQTMTQAFSDINSGAWGRRAIPSENINNACVRTVARPGAFLIEVRKNFVEQSVVSINTNKKIYIDFGTYTLTSRGVALDIYGGNVEIYAKGNGGIVAKNDAKARCVQVRAGNVKVNGGRYIAIGNGGSACAFQSAGTLVVKNAIANVTDNYGQARCVSTVGGSNLTLINCKMKAVSRYGRATAFYNAQNTTASVSGGSYYASSNYEHKGNTSYAYNSVGINNYGTLQLRNVDVYGTHSGVQSTGNLDVVGGNYSGYGHGGFYIAGVDNVAHIKNASVSCSEMPTSYTATIGCNNAAIYIGGEGTKNTKVYVDNCDFVAKTQPIVLRGSSGETGCALYISNSTMSLKQKIRIDSNHIVYLGKGNMFDASIADNPSKVINTDLIYS